jgi:hypothetical protein
LVTSNLNQFGTCLSGEAHEVQPIILEDIKGGTAIEEILEE